MLQGPLPFGHLPLPAEALPVRLRTPQLLLQTGRLSAATAGVAAATPPPAQPSYAATTTGVTSIHVPSPGSTTYYRLQIR